MDDASVRTSSPAPTGRSSLNHNGKRKLNNVKTSFMAIVVVAVIALLTICGLFLFKSNSSMIIDDSKYQALFLTNGQVYFGKLQTVNSDYVKLTDIYYLQSKTSTDNKGLQDTSSSSDVQLIKLGDEIHGPSDAMVVNKDQVLFFENLKADGKVSKSIAEYIKNKNK